VNIVLTKRDLQLLYFILKFKVVTFKQIEKRVFSRSTSTVSKRLSKLRQKGYITVIGRNYENNHSHIYSLTKYGFNTLQKDNGRFFLVDRFKSNSVSHDVTLVEIESILSSMNCVENFWPENIIQCSKEFADDDSLSYFRDFNFDGLIKYSSGTSGSFIFGVEYECTQKGFENYKIKLSQIYNHARPQVILYICKDTSIERVIKKSRTRSVSKSSKKTLLHSDFRTT
jgi:DNA-binding PadR family transcriptional regulator